MNEKRIYLTGFMTSGKSTIAPILANVLGFNFFDLDLEIEREEKSTVVEIFEQKGEKYFRELEAVVLKNISTKGDVVVALGGGTIINEDNFYFLKNSGKIIYLKISPEILYKRLKNKINRPLFRDLVLEERPKEDFIQRINEILELRKKYYEKADIIIEPGDKPFGLIVDKIAKKILEMFNEGN
jgi:shikimate kinase